MTIWRFLNIYWQRVSRFGTNSSMSYPLMRRVMLANHFSIIISLVSVAFTVLFLSRGDFIPVPVMALVVVTLSILFLNKYGFIRLTRFLVSIAPAFAILSLNIMSKVTNPERIEAVHYISARLLIIASVALPLTLYTIQEKKIMFLAVSVIVLLVVAYDWLHMVFNVAPQDLGIVIPEVFKPTIFEDLMLMSIILGSAFGFLLQMNSQYDKQNKLLLKDAKSKNQQLNQREAELKETLSKVETAQREEERRNWVTKGLAEFVSKMRTMSEEQDFLNHLISDIVKYLDANQAGLYLLYDEGETDKAYLQLEACYAYNRKKFIEQRYESGQGIIGQSVLEKEAMHLSEIPDDYLNITSGVGEALPKFITVQPLIINETVEGVLEIASFKEFDPYEREFIQKLSENIAAFVSSHKVSKKTQELIKKQAEYAEKLKAKETEMLQNVEELHATQEQMLLKEKSYKQKIKGLEQQLEALQGTSAKA